MKVYVGNAFSLSMLSKLPAKILVLELTDEEAKNYIRLGAESAIGHESTAKVLSQILSTEVPANRRMITLEPGDCLVVFQLLQRLPEGTVLSEEEVKKLPYKFYLVEVL